MPLAGASPTPLDAHSHPHQPRVPHTQGFRKPSSDPVPLDQTPDSSNPTSQRTAHIKPHTSHTSHVPRVSCTPSPSPSLAQGTTHP
eukprot:281991-Prorocentrum_minimum.AAC.3